MVAASYLMGRLGRHHLVAVAEFDNGELAATELIRHLVRDKDPFYLVLLDNYYSLKITFCINIWLFA